VLRECNEEGFARDPQFLSLAIACVDGARQFMRERGLVALQPERYIRSSFREVSGHPGLLLRFSGKIDLVAHNPRGGLTVLDYKTGRAIPNALDLAALPSSFIYTYLARCLRSQDPRVAACGGEIEIVQLLPHMAESSSAVLTAEEILAGRNVLREMAVAMAEERTVPMPGEHCAYCPIPDLCPARPQLADWERESF
jgi:RecB family exonuclease